MPIVTLIAEQTLGKIAEGDQIQVDGEAAESLCSTGVFREATADDVAGAVEDSPEEALEEEDNDEEKEEDDEYGQDDPNDMVQESVRRTARNIESTMTKAVEKAAHKIREQAEVKRPKLYATARDRAEEGRGGFKNIGEFVQVSVRKSRGDGTAIRAMERCKAMNMALVREKGSMTIGGGSGHQGGDLVPQEWAKDLWKLAFDKVPDLHGMCQQYPMEHQTLNIPLWVQSSPTAGVTSSVVSEGSLISDTVGVTATAQLNLVKFTALVNVTDELERFNAYALDSVLRQIVPQRIRYSSNDAIVNGTNGQVNLIGNAATTVVTRATAGRINYNDITAMEAALFDDFTEDAIWLVNPGTMPEVYSLSFPNRTATTPIPAFTPGTFNDMLGPKPKGELLGRPIYRLENVPSLGYLGDIILYSPKSIAAATTGLIADSTPFLYFNYAENTYRFMWYADTVSLMNVPYTRKGGGNASNIVILSSASSSA